MTKFNRIAVLSALAFPLALGACASKKDLDALRLDVQRAQQTADQAVVTAQQAATDSHAAAEQAKEASDKADRVYSRSLRK